MGLAETAEGWRAEEWQRRKSAGAIEGLMECLMEGAMKCGVAKGAEVEEIGRGNCGGEGSRAGDASVPHLMMAQYSNNCNQDYQHCCH